MALASLASGGSVSRIRKPPSAKYKSDTDGVQTELEGPVRRRFATCASIFCALPDMVVFNVLSAIRLPCRRTVSIMIRGNGASLAPMYDVVCGEVWENITKNQQKHGRAPGAVTSAAGTDSDLRTNAN